MIPGVKVKDEQLDEGELMIRRMETIILSMTPQEREKPSIINPSRKRRIAAGSGTRVEDVNRLLRQFEQMQKMVKQLSSMSKGKKGMRGLGAMMGGQMPGMPF